eukprot:5236238-Amphidinium_carterae.1
MSRKKTPLLYLPFSFPYLGKGDDFRRDSATTMSQRRHCCTQVHKYDVARMKPRCGWVALVECLRVHMSHT